MIVCPLGIIGYNFGLVKFYWIVSLIQLAVTLVLNMYFLPVWGVAGAIAAWFGSDIIGMSLVVVAVVRKVLLVESRQEAVVCHTMGEQSFYETE